MARDFFKNLPNTTTPLTAPRLNALLDGDEPMGNIKVDSVQTKNLLNIPDWTNTINGITFKIQDGKLTTSGTFSSTVSRTININPITLKAGVTYTLSSSKTQYPYIGLIDSNETQIGRTDYNTGKLTITPENNTIITRMSVYIGAASGVGVTITPQLEEGTTRTDFYVHKYLGYTSGLNSNGNYIKYDDGTLIQWGTIDKTVFNPTSELKTTVQNIDWYRSKDPTIPFPIEFIDTNYSVNTQFNNRTSGSRVLIVRTTRPEASRFQVQLISIEPFYNDGIAYSNLDNIEWIAIGRWK